MNPSTDTFRLPETWTALEEVEDVIVADEISIHRAGLSTIDQNGTEVCGSAAGTDPAARERAWFELLERVSAHEAAARVPTSYELVDDVGGPIRNVPRADVFPESDSPRWRYARSNGIALHVDWQTACRRAHWELAERDRVVRAWHGETTPLRLADDLVPQVLRGARSYEWRAYSFPEAPGTQFSRGIEVVGVFGLPLRADLPFALGLAGRPTISAALEAAGSEALQILAFLWGEALPEGPLSSEPGPSQHLDAYQMPGSQRVIREWLDGGHSRYAPDDHGRREGGSGVGFVDLTPSWLGGSLRVAKAVCDEALPLAFGDSPFVAHLPPELRLHPIP